MGIRRGRLCRTAITSLGGCGAVESTVLLAVPLASAAPRLPSHQFPFRMMLRLHVIPRHLSPSSRPGQGDLPGKGMFHPQRLAAMIGGMSSLGEGCPDTSLGWWTPSTKDLAGWGGEGEGKKPQVSHGEAAKGETTWL